ncbi:hypothetical protein EVAR_9347_1 [Eumeta japonica]|uniref:Uncharacterized protein n=1 Tax=Eumeta variegata TaxID=151549 RepID=A0A4C1YUK6_EUMVA|nr:hypothetical protein EVAR_9347_1 [Eumeta japonica]
MSERKKNTQSTRPNHTKKIRYLSGILRLRIESKNYRPTPIDQFQAQIFLENKTKNLHRNGPLANIKHPVLPYEWPDLNNPAIFPYIKGSAVPGRDGRRPPRERHRPQPIPAPG